jgi:hypothetical protein
MTENRRSHRIPFDCLVEFDFGDYRMVCELYDISLRGALVGACSGATPPPGTACKLILELDGNSDERIVMQGEIAHKIENRVGIHCLSIDIDSMTHLRRLVEYNLGESSLLERDLEALLS